MQNYFTPETYIEQQLKEQEFRYWDAQRNGCSETFLNLMEHKVNALRAQLLAAQVKSVHSVLGYGR